jgi:myosin heavy subunit
LNGLFTIVNDASKSKPRPTYEQLMNSITSVHKGNEKIETNFIKNKKRDKFTIKHSAKEVEYDIKTFIVKNVDEISSSLELFMQTESDALIANIFLQRVPELTFENNEEDEGASPSRGATRLRSIWSKFS